VDLTLEFDRRSGPVDAERALEARGTLETVRRHLAAMNPSQAETVFLHDAIGHELAEIAVITGVSVAAAQSRLVRGRKELFRRLDRERTRQQAERKP
jgi:RNA polymerase sigma-70 factor (ECF subfamily)